MADERSHPIYLDFNATTPLDPRVFEVMREWYLGPPANAGSRTHIYGHRAKEAVEIARAEVANVISAQPEEIIFTSGATESNNLAILGLATYGEKTGRKHIVSTQIEHKAVLEPLEYLATKGFEIELAPVRSGGFVDPDDVINRCREDTLLVSVMHANNETGILQPVSQIGKALCDSKIFFHIDAAQTFGKEKELAAVDFDLLSVSSHKIYGPQGIGVLCSKRRDCQRIPLSPLGYGGGQERKIRPGTVPVALAVGLGYASQIALRDCDSRKKDSIKTKSALLESLKNVDHQVNGDVSQSQDHVINLRFPGVDSEALMMALRESIAFSNGSACTSDSYDPSHVLIAMGLTEDEANESVRFSWGPGVNEIPSKVLAENAEHLRVDF